MQYIKIHSQDNVAVALADMAAGTQVTIDDDAVTLSQDVVRGHKFALRAIAKGENVIKYGLPIGHALADIAPGEHIHAHNTRTNLSDLDEYRYQPDLAGLRRSRPTATCSSIVVRTVRSGCAMNCGSCRPSAVSTVSPVRFRTGF
jgi:bifunctional pyridoxal-dependent enzyme with beta-cystathionase and maltose regulon repressor activities